MPSLKFQRVPFPAVLLILFMLPYGFLFSRVLTTLLHALLMFIESHSSLGSAARLPGFRSWHYQCTAYVTSGEFLDPFSLSFFICKNDT